MKERIYKTISTTGVWSMVLGIIAICLSVAAGVVLIVNGVKLLKARTEILF